MAAADDRPPTHVIVTDEYHDLETPVRLEWSRTSAGPEWLAQDHPGLATAERPGRDRQPQTWHSSIVVPLHRKEEGFAAGPNRSVRRIRHELLDAHRTADLPRGGRAAAR